MLRGASTVSKFIAIITIVISVPLLLSYNLKFGPFLPGIIYAVVWSWAVVSYFLVPVLLAVELGVGAWVAFKTVGPERKVLSWHVAAALIAVAAETTALLVRRLAN
jgi:hypothetical protein